MNKELIIKDILKEIDGNLICGDENETLSDFSINTKTLNKGDVFVGMVGDNSDGSKYYLNALENGAKGCIINKGFVKDKDESKFIIEVDDTLKALQKLASIKRDMYDIPVIAVTGSVGKTSTKDIIASVVSKKYNVLKTEGNYNNGIGMPLTILRLKNHEALVVEMGMNSFGEISLLSKIAKPTIGVITNVGTAHIGNLGSRENILKAKLEIMDGLNGKLVINNDNDLLNKWNNDKKLENVITVGIDNESNFNGTDIKYEEKYSTFKCNNNEYKINVSGNAFIYNALSGIAVGTLLDIDPVLINNGLESFSLTSGRNETIKTNGYTLINDCYNASLDSIKEALSNLSKASNRKIAVLGDVLELGEYSKEIHEKIGEEVLKNNIDILVLVGKESLNTYKVTKDKMNSNYFNNNEDAIKYLKSIIKEDDTILVKASHGMKFIEIIDSLK
ncbi:MAG: UDP-N-acetylmuramoyl-tripeptide--D-alanyl-D-alanine ligase [Bacilli bacterium]|nr:UDP-N-acetylmuramoyl-tripeptide--D-alanyl-D-alanine ligase [Bacilli bacterium]